MGWFFFISAYWYFKKYDKTEFVEKICKRTKTLLFPYIIFNLIAILCCF